MIVCNIDYEWYRPDRLFIVSSHTSYVIKWSHNLRVSNHSLTTCADDRKNYAIACEINHIGLLYQIPKE